MYGLNDGYFECVDIKTGRQVWKDERRPRTGEGWGHGQILLCDDLIVGLTEETREMVLVEATPEAYRELGRIKVFTRGKKTWNNPAMAHGRIYIRNEEEMVCYDLTGK
jgi:outer membrane protein assembly factor BamB